MFSESVVDGGGGLDFGVLFFYAFYFLPFAFPLRVRQGFVSVSWPFQLSFLLPCILPFP